MPEVGYGETSEGKVFGRHTFHPVKQLDVISKSQFRRLVIQLQCKKHPKYKAVRKPRIPCADCWRLWNFKHGGPLPS